MRTTPLTRKIVVLNILLRLFLMAVFLFIVFSQEPLFQGLALDIFASVVAVSTVASLICLGRLSNYFLGYKISKTENQTERWYSKIKCLCEELLFPYHLFQYAKQGCPKTEVLRFFQPYENVVYDEDGCVVDSKFELLWYTYNRSVILWLTGIDHPYYRFN